MDELATFDPDTTFAAFDALTVAREFDPPAPLSVASLFPDEPDDVPARPWLPGELEAATAEFIRKRDLLEADRDFSTDREETAGVESEEVSSGLLNRPPNMCIAANMYGGRCGAYKRIGTDYCAAHDPEYRETMRRNRSRGGSRGSSRPDLPVYLPPDLRDLDFDLIDPSRMQGSMSALMRMLTLGYISPAVANTLMRYYNGAMRNLVTILRNEERRREGNVIWPCYEQFLKYGEAMANLAQAASEIKKRIDAQDEARRARDLEGAAARAEELASVQQRHRPAAPLPRMNDGVRPLLAGIEKVARGGSRAVHPSWQ